MTRNNVAAILATVAVIVVVVLGFRTLGSPGKQRLVNADLRVVQSLAELARQIQFRWNNEGNTLPATLDTIPVSVKQNPITHEMFVYHVKSKTEYELCATFVTDDRDAQTPDGSSQWAPARWAHANGQYCFQLDASQPVPQAPYVY